MIQTPFADRVGSVLNSYKVMAIDKVVKECLAYPLGLLYGSKRNEQMSTADEN